jgi:hypothetical protein
VARSGAVCWERPRACELISSQNLYEMRPAGWTFPPKSPPARTHCFALAGGPVLGRQALGGGTLARCRVGRGEIGRGRKRPFRGDLFFFFSFSLWMTFL